MNILSLMYPEQNKEEIKDENIVVDVIRAE